MAAAGGYYDKLAAVGVLYDNAREQDNVADDDDDGDRLGDEKTGAAIASASSGSALSSASSKPPWSAAASSASDSVACPSLYKWTVEQ